MNLQETFKGKRVFLTGHTGFKGSWLLQILHHFGAIVKGYALAPENDNDLYNQIEGDKLCYASVIADLKDAHLLKGEMVRFEPDFVFHLAAQPLVRYSYEHPVTTFETNVMGTIHVLEAMRSLQKPCVGIMVTTDKVYENNESGNAFNEDEKLGGYDPYSASKAACEIAIASYRNSFFNPSKYHEHQKSIASVRAGNVIGGGDFAADRIIPDIVRAIEHNEDVVLRNPKAVRPWQHVLEPLFVYLSLAEKMLEEPVSLATAFNIGPEKTDILDVETVTRKFINSFGKGNYSIEQNANNPHEANLLMLDNQKIKDTLGWSPKYDAAKAIQVTADWYANKEQCAAEKCLEQIQNYMNLSGL
ncbi:CDP-glucose 4,6-dehydratase [Taibaiella lutea]|uniref:CDP-glucose 4,6-dehydratase n=1 Tax=Taibaiella lutea TaxID=2608001 RepID=A0A5M6CB80_9BACT|nr:CDP-glucose 4,6-dehydratase [Taibaiella lutea]KAA5532436.1 CDP-glucose 4,6-dehydratase [Taibaiella lutea]